MQDFFTSQSQTKQSLIIVVQCDYEKVWSWIVYITLVVIFGFQLMYTYQ